MTTRKSAGFVRVDNGEIVKKIGLRRIFSRGVDCANIYLAGSGKGELLRSVWLPKANYLLTIDCDPIKVAYLHYHFPGVDARLDDFDRFASWPEGVRFHAADFDAYGSPYSAIANFFSSPRWQCPFHVFVTDGIPLWLGRGGVLPRQLRSEAIARPVADRHLRGSYLDACVWPWWDDLATRNALHIVRTAVVWKKGKKVVYYALQLDH